MLDIYEASPFCNEEISAAACMQICLNTPYYYIVDVF